MNPARHRKFLPDRATGFAILAAFICAAPVFAVAWIAVTGETGDYLTHLARTRLPAYLWNSLLVGMIAAGGAGLIGTGLGWLVARTDFPGRRLLGWVLILPLAVPAYVAAYAWLDLSQAGGRSTRPRRASSRRYAAPGGRG